MDIRLHHRSATKRVWENIYACGYDFAGTHST
ncbi:MAG: hypothetical protein RLZ97_1120, partial [Verrucomicrobiota bacterium]